MKTKVTFKVSNFEPLSEKSKGNLVGGFSLSLSNENNDINTMSNNCNGGNCVSGCGSGSNTGCNTFTGCGVKLN